MSLLTPPVLISRSNANLDPTHLNHQGFLRGNMHKDANFEQLEFYLKESLIMYQTIEAVLKDYIENAWRLQAASTPYLLKTAPEKAIKKLQTKTMGTLIEHFADLSLNENLISNLQSLNKTRNSIAHGRFYKINMKRIKDEFSEEELNKACVESEMNATKLNEWRKR